VRPPLRALALPLVLGLALAAVDAGQAAPRAAPAPAEDPLDLPALLLSDGHLDRAEAALAALDPADPAVDPGRYHRLRGLLRLQRGDAAGALADLEAALAAGPADAALSLSLARAAVAADQPARAIAALDAAGEPVEALPSTPRVRALALQRMGRPADALAALEAGAARFPAERGLRQQQVELLAGLNLHQEALSRAQSLAAEPGGDLAELRTLAELLRRAGAPGEAAVLLEGALLRAPLDPELRARAAACQLDLGRPGAAARLLEPLALHDPAWADEVAELHRKAGATATALRWSARVPEPTPRLRQRFGLLIEQGDIERAAALAPRLEAAGLLREDSVRYGLAWAWAGLGEAARAEALLGGISDPAVFAQATALRAQLQRCAAEGGCG